MRIAIISDIHSNLEALTKALEIIDERSVDEIICLGDIVGYGPNPNECLELIRRRCTLVIRGNHDDAIHDVRIMEHFTEGARSAIIWTRKQLSEDNLAYLKTLPLTGQKENSFFVHASPCTPAEWDYIFEEDAAAESFHCFSESLCFIGHTHIPAMFSSNGRLDGITRGLRSLINVGSIGQPRDRNLDLSFGLFDSESWTYENIRSPYHVETTVMKILKTDLPSRMGHRLLMGV